MATKIPTNSFKANLDNSKVEVIRGRGKLTGPTSVMVEGQVYTAEHILLATGGYPTIPSLPGAELGITSDGFFDLKQQPKSILVVGAGYIAVEMAQILATLGTKTTLACRSDQSQPCSEANLSLQGPDSAEEL